MTANLSEWLRYKERLEKEIRNYQRLSDTIAKRYKHINRLYQVGQVYEFANQIQQLSKQLSACESLTELLAQVDAIQERVARNGIDEGVGRAISVLHSQACLMPEVASLEVITSIRALYKSVERVLDNPVQRIYQSKTAAELFQSRLESLKPRFVPYWKDVRESDDFDNLRVELVIADTETPEGERDADISVLPGVLSLEDVFTDISSTEAMDFYHHLSKFPMLGTTHPVGERILKSAQGLECREANEIVLYRGRVKKRGKRPFTEEEMWSPPLERALQGRANPQGVSYLYTCDTFEGVLAELESSLDEVVDIIQWCLVRPVRVFELSACSDVLVSYCRFGSDGGDIKPEYLVPNYLAQCLAYAGIHAMKIPSVKHPSSNTYVFFTYERQWFEKIGFCTDVDG